jgi:hypothetical protein
MKQDILNIIIWFVIPFSNYGVHDVVVLNTQLKEYFITGLYIRK